MTCGIYKLSFSGTIKVYIGQSLNIESRYKRHLSDLRKGANSKKLREAYLKFGAPILDILTECTKEELDSFENETIDIWDAVDNGFNTKGEAGHRSTLCGEYNPCSKYTNNQIILAFELLVSYPELTYKSICEEVCISIEALQLLASGVSHKWLDREFPDKYAVLLSMIGTRKSNCQSAKAKGIDYPLIKDTDNNIYNVDNTAGFARQHGLNQAALHRLLTYKVKSHKGWRLV